MKHDIFCSTGLSHSILLDCCGKFLTLAGKSPTGLAFIQADEERGERQVIVKVPEPAAPFGLQGFLVCGSRAIKTASAK